MYGAEDAFPQHICHDYYVPCDGYDVHACQWDCPLSSVCVACNPSVGMNDGEQAGQLPDWGMYQNSIVCEGRPLDCIDTLNHDPFAACRVGEAKHPGPFRISALNIQSLHCALNENKLDWTNNQVLALSETCATQYVLDKAAKAAAARGRHVFSSIAVQRRHFKRGTISESRGESAGTWVASEVHCRPLDTPWPDDLDKLCRATDAVLYTPNGPVYLACLYGFHQGFTEASARTDKILEAIFERSQLLKIPAVVVGDFNSSLENMPVWGCMCERGWRDAALCHEQRTGHSPQPTFKEVSRIDFVIMNDLAQRAFLKYESSELPISDHRMVSVDFDWSKCSGLATMYKMPRDWAQLGLDGQLFSSARVPVGMQAAFDSAICTGNVDRVWEAFTDAMEQVAKNVVAIHGKGPLPPKFLGKNKCKFVRLPMSAPVIKKGRNDCFQCEVQDSGVMLRQRITQIRRLDAYIAQCNAAGPITPQRTSAMQATWRAVIEARGFGGKFPRWFINEFERPCPLNPPPMRVADWMRRQMSELVPRWRNLYNNTRIKNLRDAFQNDWAKGGRLFHQALKSPQPPPVDTIYRAIDLRVQIMRARKKSVSTFRLLDDDLHTVSIGQRWSQNGAEGFVSDIRNGLVSVHVSKGSFKTGIIKGETPCYDPKESLRLATDFWESFWVTKDHVDTNDEAVTRVIQSLPELQPISRYISLNEVSNCLKNLPVTKARGMDAVSNWELKYLCPDLQCMLQQVLNFINTSCRWPQPLTDARMHLIRKSAAPGDINSTRPICILPNVYRLWGKIMTSKCFKHLRDRIPPTLCGSVPGRSSIDLAMQLQCEAEHHIITGEPLYGASVDLRKAFNTLNRPLLGKMCLRLGLGEVWAPYSIFLSSLRRFFTLKQQWSQPVCSNTGVPEGCPLSVVMMMITTWAMTEKLQSTTPRKPMSSYVDDWTLRDTSPEKLVEQLREVTETTQKIGLHLSTAKTIAYATLPQARKRLARCLKEWGFPSDVQDTGTCLGIQIQSRNAKVIDMREQRVTDSTPKLKRLKIMPWSNPKKATMLLTGIFPSMLYGCEFHDMGLHFISHIRSQCNGAVWKDKP